MVHDPLTGCAADAAPRPAPAPEPPGKSAGRPASRPGGPYRVRPATSAGDHARAEALRARLFRGDPGKRDRDGFDPLCRHMLVEDASTGAVVCTWRMLSLDGGGIGASYSALVYDLAALRTYPGRMLEIGRFCIAPEARGADVLRLAWGAVARAVAAERVALLFGCTTLPGGDVAALGETFALLHRRHLAPARLRPAEKAPEVIRFAAAPDRDPDTRVALKAMPPLLRSYLAMGGWVSDHAVRDRDLGTLHVFTGLEVARVPAPRRRALRALAGGDARARAGA